MSSTMATKLLEVVEASPALVAAHDKERWLGLFAPDGVVEDPVGTTPHRRGRRRDPSGNDELGRFWDVFIAPNDIRFEVRTDAVDPPFVMRDVQIHTTTPSGSRVQVPAHLLYELSEHAGAMRIARLAAHWELGTVTRQVIANGPSGWRELAMQSWRLAQVQGLAGTGGQLRGLMTGAGRRGKRAMQLVAEAMNAGDAAAVARLLTVGGRLEWPPGRCLSPGELLDRLGGQPLRLSRSTAAGWVVSFGFELGPARGVGLADFDPVSRRIWRLRWFVAGPTK